MHGKDRYDLPNSSNYGFSTGGFAGPDGSLLVTECHEGLVRIWRWRDGTLVGLVESAKKEPIAVLPDAVVYRDSKSRQLRVVALPGGSW
jgi:hypothetical protein